MRTEKLDKSRYIHFLGRADRFLKAAENAYASGFWDVCISNSIHAAIAAADAVNVKTLGLRSTSPRHEDALALLTKTYQNDSALQQNVKRLEHILSGKSEAEYGSRALDEDDATATLKDVNRFIDFVKDRVGRQ